ncbi:MAG: MFS transporter, partial [Aestuariivirga sp.]
MDRRNLVNLSAAIAAITVFGFTLGLMFPLLSLIMEKRGIGADWIGYNAAMQPLGIVLSVFAIPPLVRRFGAKTAVIGASLLTAGVVLAYPFFPVFWWWFGLRILHGACVSVLFAVSEAWIVRFAEGPWRSRLLSVYVAVLAASFGGGPVLISITGINGPLPFAIGAVVLVIATIPIAFLRDEIAASSGEQPLSLLGFAGKAPMLLAAVAIFAIIDSANLGFLPVYGVKKGMDEETAALALSAFILGNTVLQFPVGWLADHVPKHMVSAGCCAVTAIACGLIPY